MDQIKWLALGGNVRNEGRDQARRLATGARQVIDYKFKSLSPIQAALSYAREKSKYTNDSYSCMITVNLIMQGLHLRGQKMSQALTQIMKEQEKKLIGGMHPSIQQQLQNARFFIIGIYAWEPKYSSYNTKHFGEHVLINGKIYRAKKLEKNQGVSSDHFLFFYKKQNTNKEIYYLYQSWEKEFSLDYWMQRSNQFEQISTQLFEEKIYPYQNPFQYIKRYFQKLKDFKDTQFSCPACGERTQESQSACNCAEDYQLLQEPWYEPTNIQMIRRKEEALQLTKQQYAWGIRMGYFNTFQYYLVSK